MGRRLLDEVVHRIRIRIKAGEAVPAIAEAVKVGKKTIYKIRLNLNIWGEPYAPPTIVLGQPRALLPYQETVIYNVIVLSFLLTTYVEAS
jgi:transposase